jgi:hypothetical protein
MVRDRLLVKPPKAYDEFVVDALRFALPMLREYRRSIGFSDSARINPIGDLLRLHPDVRAWKPDHGRLSIQINLKKYPTALKTMVEELCKTTSWVCKRRTRDGKLVYSFNEAELKRALLA